MGDVLGNLADRGLPIAPDLINVEPVSVNPALGMALAGGMIAAMRDFYGDPLRLELLSQLSGFRRAGGQAVSPHGAGLFTYCTVNRERLRHLRLEHPILAVVLSGSKEIWHGDRSERLGTGSVLVLPSGVDLDIVNDPDGRSGVYEAMILEITPDRLPDDLPEVGRNRGGGHSVPLSAALIEALRHAATEVACGAGSGHVRQARMTELLALLADEPAAAPLFALPLEERLRRMFRARPDRDWRCAEVARTLGLSDATLRRKLRGQGAGFNDLLRTERMGVARDLLEGGMASGAVALSVGYASRAHFARSYRAVYGCNPSGG